MATGFRILAATAVVSAAALASQQLWIAKPDSEQTGVRFETASIERSRAGGNGYSGHVENKPRQPVKLTLQNVSLQFCVQQAFGVNEYQVTGPGWIKSARYDIEATLPPGTRTSQVWPALRTLLVERLQLSVGREKKVLPVYRLSAATGGARLGAVKDGVPEGLKFKPERRRGVAQSGGSGTMHLDAASMATFCADLSRHLRRPVLDATGISGNYAIDLRYSGPSQIGHALEKQLGLKLDPGKDEIEMIVVEKALRKPN